MWRHYVYIHRKASTGEPFYVGKGSLRARQKSQGCERAYTYESRNRIWCRTVTKHGLFVEIVASCIDDAAAQEIERTLIRTIGRRNLRQGPLINLTDGGDGHAGLIPSAATRRRLSVHASKPRSAAWIASIRRARKNGGNGGVVKHGDKLPASWRASIAATKRGADNPMFGRCGDKHPNGRKVVDGATGAIYPTVTAAAAALGLRMQTLHNMLTGFRQNNTAMRLP